MRVTKGLMVLAAAVMLAPSAAQAQVLGQFQWAGTGSSFGWSYKRANNSNVGVMGGAAYRANFKMPAGSPGYLPPHGTTSFGPAVDIYCVDFKHTAQGAYSAYFTNLAGSPSLTKTRSTDLSQYLKAVWLIQKMDAQTFTAAGKEVRADIHAAIWYLMSGDPVAVQHGPTYTNTGLNSWLGQANANWQDGSVNAAEWTVVTDACVANSGTNGQGFSAVDSCSQEFLTRNVTPEPATMILLGTGLLATLAMTGVIRRNNA